MKAAIEGFLAVREAHFRQETRARGILKGRMRFERILRKRWALQRRAILKHNTLRDLVKAREALDPGIEALILRALLPGAIQASLQGLVSAGDVEMVNGILSATIIAGAGATASELERALRNVDMGETQRAWIRAHGFEKLAADIDRVTVQRLKDRVGEIYVRGGSYSEMVTGIRETFEGFSQTRAELIATTEMNAAYNHGGLEFALNVGAKTKRWNPLGTNVCPVCIANESQGSIPAAGAFQSGHESPPAHPRCNCVLDFGFI